MQSGEYNEYQIPVIEAVVFSEFLCALSKDNDIELRNAEQNIYAALKMEHLSENNIRQIYFRMLYQMELKEAYISNTREFAYRLYIEMRDLHTLEDFHGEFIRRIEQTDSLRSSTYSEAVISTMRHIQNELGNEDLSIRLLSEYVYLTPNYLAAVFKKETGVTIGQYCLKQRMERAKQLLGNKKLKLNQIARSVGYRDANYFTKIFKREVGCIPSEYREQKWKIFKL